MKFKKLALSFGTLAAVAAPIAAVVSCGEPSSSQYSESDLLKMSNLKSSEAHSKLQDLWLAKVLGSAYGIDATNSTPLDILKNLDNPTTKGAKTFENDFKATLIWVLKNKLSASKDTLSSIYQTLKTNAPDSILEDATLKPIIDDNLNVKVFDRTQVSDAVDAVVGSTDSWKTIFYNYTEDKTLGTTFNPSILGIKDLVLKMMITKKYLSISGEEFKKALPDEYAKLDSKFRDTTLVDPNAKNFPLVISAMNNRLAYKTSIDLAANKSREFIISNIENKLNSAELPNVFDKTNSKFKSKLTYTISHESRIDEILAKIPGYTTTANDTIGFQGLSSLPTGEDDLNTNTASAIKLSKTATSRDGFVVTSKSGTKLVTSDVRFTDEDKTKVEVNYYTSLMPTYDAAAKTLIWDSKVKMDILMNEAYTKDTSLYSSAIKYYTSEADGMTPILINVTNDWARNYYIDEGLTYVNKEKQ